jgi:hypothetical protein
MANAQVGNRIGWTAAGNSGYVAGITADGANTVTVDDIRDVPVGANVDLVNKNTGAVLASNRQITNLTSAGVLTYGGADVAAVPGTTVIVLTGTTTQTGYSNLNGGSSPSAGFNMGGSELTIDSLRARLQAINATTYSNAQLDMMTENDMLYALRLVEAPGSVK